MKHKLSNIKLAQVCREMRCVTKTQLCGLFKKWESEEDASQRKDASFTTSEHKGGLSVPGREHGR